MSQRKLTAVEREQIYIQKQAGKSLLQIAKEMGISYECARKWWRRGRDEGIGGLLERKRGRQAQGILSQFSLEVQRVCLDLKRAHKRWGANRVLIEMGNDPGLSGMKLPSRSRLYPYFRQHCPDCLNIWTKHKWPVPGNKWAGRITVG